MRDIIMLRSRWTLLIVSLLALLATWQVRPAAWAEFRSMQPIATPHQTWTQEPTAGAAAGNLPSDVRPTPEIEKLAQEARARAPQFAREAMQRLVLSWNQGDAARHLSADFVDRERFLTSWDGQVPRDARVRLLAIEGIQPLDQDNRLEGSPPTLLHVDTRVSVRATTQIEFNDPQRGFQRREGRNEYIFRIKQRIPLTAGK
ncbi:MAG: hypothetical protein OZSIB_1057 [Candidatus Ozemobacter sibiricus]|jgi:hypothetical protein|uniref:Uncharacterized protein n=1 Tax=Candidatus Ozemobacter sibiricus TaxID=2268124 RepID=A0A367ZM30_9BACT|nr:MAG: hypothetical protein OZSIB_1057 [Candidatus Ozemobacter sibiricus]